MGKPKEAVDRCTEQVGYRITLGEKAAVEEMAKLRRARTGDDSMSGWFRELLRREAKRVGVKVDDTLGAEATTRPATKKAADRGTKARPT